MRSLCVAGLIFGLLLATLQPSAAQDACPAGASALGVSRTIEIDTTSGPRFGFQYKEHELLADGEIVLTFDDGPARAYTKAVLDALDANCTKATFFLVGRMAVADPEMVREYARRGHSVGTHTWSHANLQALSPLRARAEIELGFSAVQQAMGKPIAPFFRFPYLRDTGWLSGYLRSRQIAAFSINIDSKDFQTRDPRTVHRRVMDELARVRKGIILFHDIQPSTARALPGLLAELKAKGYRIVHLKPKEPVATVAEFDTQAEQMLAARKVASASHPLAKRALTWGFAVTETRPQPTAGEPPAARPPRSPRPQARGYGQTEWPFKLWTW
jgi:peptidoglycan/xylan/chitin deacetylase (PgdA/CDA1 family)